MKRSIIAIAIAILFISISTAYSLERVTVAISTSANTSANIDVEVVDLETSNTEYSENFGSLTSNSSGIIAFTVGDGVAAWTNIDPANVDGKWVVNVNLNGSLYAQYRLDQLTFNQVFHEQTLPLSGDLDMDDNNITNLTAITGNSVTNKLTINDDLELNGKADINAGTEIGTDIENNSNSNATLLLNNTNSTWDANTKALEITTGAVKYSYRNITNSDQIGSYENYTVIDVTGDATFPADANDLDAPNGTVIIMTNNANGVPFTINNLAGGTSADVNHRKAKMFVKTSAGWVPLED